MRLIFKNMNATYLNRITELAGTLEDFYSNLLLEHKTLYPFILFYLSYSKNLIVVIRIEVCKGQALMMKHLSEEYKCPHKLNLWPMTSQEPNPLLKEAHHLSEVMGVMMMS